MIVSYADTPSEWSGFSRSATLLAIGELLRVSRLWHSRFSPGLYQELYRDLDKNDLINIVTSNSKALPFDHWPERAPFRVNDSREKLEDYMVSATAPPGTRTVADNYTAKIMLRNLETHRQDLQSRSKCVAAYTRSITFPRWIDKRTQTVLETTARRGVLQPTNAKLLLHPEHPYCESVMTIAMWSTLR